MGQIKTPLVVFALLTSLTFQALAFTEPSGFGSVTVTYPPVIAAARYAVQTYRRQTKSVLILTSIDKAQQEMVAGMNYKICLHVKSKGKVLPAETIVYQNPDFKRSLTSWKWGKCSF